MDTPNRTNADTRPLVIGLLLAAAASVGVTLAMSSGCSDGRASDRRTTAGVSVERGKYLVTIASCNDCHTPFKMGEKGPEPDMTRMLSGHPSEFQLTSAPNLGDGPYVWAGTGTNTAFAGPWGISFAANLTPDPATGLVVDEAAFVQALRTGKHMGAGRPILPPMPWPFISQMTDDDLKSVYAFLRTIPAIENEVPSPVPPDQVQIID